MTEAEARDAVREARLALRAGRAFVRDLNTKLARGEDALEFLESLSNAQPKEAQRHGEDEDRNTAEHGTELCAA
jgi:hypothetical protein